MKEFSVSFVNSIEEIGRDNWNALAGTDNPFIRYEFLHALESTGCTTEETGWKPMHVFVSENSAAVSEDNIPVAVMPLYLKNNSWGE
jgi:predicted N-acyltransferase